MWLVKWLARCQWAAARTGTAFRQTELLLLQPCYCNNEGSSVPPRPHHHQHPTWVQWTTRTNTALRWSVARTVSCVVPSNTPIEVIIFYLFYFCLFNLVIFYTYFCCFGICFLFCSVLLYLFPLTWCFHAAIAASNSIPVLIYGLIALVSFTVNKLALNSGMSDATRLSITNNTRCLIETKKSVKLILP